MSQCCHLAAQHTCSLTCVPVGVQGCLHTSRVHCLLVACSCILVLAVCRMLGRCMGGHTCLHACCVPTSPRGETGILVCMLPRPAPLYGGMGTHVCVPTVSVLPPTRGMEMPVFATSASQHHHLVIWAFSFAPLMCPSATTWHHASSLLSSSVMWPCRQCSTVSLQCYIECHNMGTPSCTPAVSK